MINKIRYIILIFLMINSFVYSQELVLSGFLKSDNEKVISTKYSGFVKEVNVNEGDYTKKGQSIINIDSKEIDSNLIQTKLSLSQAKLNNEIVQNEYKKAYDDYIRYKNLFDKQMISKSEYESVELKMNSLLKQKSITKQNLKQLQEQISELNEQLNYLDIKADDRYLVIEKNINEGELVSPNKVLLVLSDIDSLVLYVDIAESDILKISNSNDIKLYIESLDLNQSAKLISILPPKGGIGSFKAKLKVIKTDSKLLPAMYAKVIIK